MKGSNLMGNVVRVNFGENTSLNRNIEKTEEELELSLQIKKLADLEFNSLILNDTSEKIRAQWSPENGYAILNPLFENDLKFFKSLSQKERIQWGLRFSKLGDANLGIKLILNLCDKVDQDINFAMAVIAINQWDYKRAKDHLLKVKDVDSYRKIVIKINLIMCHLFLDELESARKLLNEVLNESSSNGHWICFGMGLLLKGQMYIGFKKYEKAHDIFIDAHKLFKKNAPSYSILSEKWILISYVYLKSHEYREKEIERFEKKCQIENRSEILRDLDYHIGVALMDPRRLSKGFFGSPYKYFCERSKSKYESIFDIKMPEIFAHNYLCGSHKSILNLKNMTWKGRRLKGFKDKKCIFESIFSDFYSPVLPGHLFSRYRDKLSLSFSEPVESIVTSDIVQFNKRTAEIELPIKLVNINGLIKINVSEDLTVLVPGK